mmetsp:Transcript_21430/g.27717  ORF Transcript_21430/g.27717 Transcript_21430/m.27717 type:complete len:87 (-) Transcript_21430:246-506(-)
MYFGHWSLLFDVHFWCFQCIHLRFSTPYYLGVPIICIFVLFICMCSPEHVPENVLQELKSTCKPLITWLEEADEEDSDGEDDEEES